MILISTWDDGAAQDLRLAKLLLKYDIPAIFYWPVAMEAYNAAEGRDSLDPAAAEFIADNFEIGSHTIHHPMLTRIPLEEARKEVIGSRALMQQRWGQKIDSFCYPRGYANDEIRDLVRTAGYTSARNTLIGNLSESPDPLWTTPTVHVGGKRRPEYAGTSWMIEGMKLLEQAGPESVFNIWGHSWEIDRYNAWAQVENFFQVLQRVMQGEQL